MNLLEAIQVISKTFNKDVNKITSIYKEDGSCMKFVAVVYGVQYFFNFENKTYKLIWK